LSEIPANVKKIGKRNNEKIQVNLLFDHYPIMPFKIFCGKKQDSAVILPFFIKNNQSFCHSLLYFLSKKRKNRSKRARSLLIF